MWCVKITLLSTGVYSCSIRWQYSASRQQLCGAHQIREGIRSRLKSFACFPCATVFGIIHSCSGWKHQQQLCEVFPLISPKSTFRFVRMQLSHKTIHAWEFFMGALYFAGSVVKCQYGYADVCDLFLTTSKLFTFCLWFSASHHLFALGLGHNVNTYPVNTSVPVFCLFCFFLVLFSFLYFLLGAISTLSLMLPLHCCVVVRVI